MVNIVLEFDAVSLGGKVFRFTIHSQEVGLFQLSSGDEIGFDLTESKEFFYVTVSRKVFLLGNTDPAYIICVPTKFNTIDEAGIMLDKFRGQFGDDLVIDP